MNAVRVVAIGVVIGASVTVGAWASHGKVGLWEVTVQNNMGGMPGMPDMSQMPPQVRAQMKARGVQMNGSGGITSRFCMTADQVANDTPVMPQKSNCKTINAKMVGQIFFADVICAGKMNATGHIQVTYSSPERYTGSESMNMKMEGGPVMHTEMTMAAHWISADCGKHHEGRARF